MLIEIIMKSYSGFTVRLMSVGMKSLEKRLREGVLAGRPKTRLPWAKIFIVVEGVYSMEGTIVKLPAILALKKKYKVVQIFSDLLPFMDINFILA